MPVYWRQAIQQTTPRKPPIEPLTGNKLAKRSRVVSVLKAQDSVTGLGFRILGAQSLRGENSGWFIVSSDPASATQDYPLFPSERFAHQISARLTPGHGLNLSVLALPSGFTQVLTDPDYDPAASGGSVELEITWYNQEGSDTSTHEVSIPASQLQYAAAPDFWTGLTLVHIPYIGPPEFASTDEVRDWSRHAELDIEVNHHNGTRIIDSVLTERPLAIAREADDEASLWTSHLFADQTPDGQGTVGWPYQRRSETSPDGNPREGQWHIMDVAAAQHLRLGPQLVSWTPYAEDTASLTAGSIASTRSTSSTFIRLWDGVATTYDPDEPGWSLSSGAFARGYSDNHPYWSSDDGVIPVLVSIWARGDGDTGTVRVQSDANHYVDIAITTTASYAWHRAYTYVRCGTGPGQPTNCQVFFRRDSGTASLEIASFQIHHSGPYDILS